jgi:hypothetical protein
MMTLKEFLAMYDHFKTVVITGKSGIDSATERANSGDMTAKLSLIAIKGWADVTQSQKVACLICEVGIDTPAGFVIGYADPEGAGFIDTFTTVICKNCVAKGEQFVTDGVTSKIEEIMEDARQPPTTKSVH